ncbi:uncharacterized protein LOC128994254 [Macrosteles quadrilineatus]|uniref:uncharacterized protein LOC128994254 n=1 Tax=Macrosteles quadrilineatus TaxID=74068 RepID=UPI0023E093C5|nr:uncharacterized protein LOC128994254 [Macrosteles quadrilineatus]
MLISGFPSENLQVLVTPSERSQEARTKDLEASFSPEGAWTAGPEFAQTPDEGLNKIDDFNRIGSNKSLSRSKRVKSFIQKKYKGISNSFGNGEAGETHVAVAPRSKSTSRANSDVSTTSWYVANDYHSDEEVLNHVTVVKVGVDVRETQNVSSVAVCDEPQVVNVAEDSVQTTENVDSRNEGGTDHHDSEEIKGEESLQDSDNETFILAQDCPDEEEISKLDKGCSEETLVDEKPQLEEVESPAPLVFEAKTEIERLTDKYFGPLYSNYPRTRPVLVRQARDLLVCSYHGNTARFEAEFCQPAAALMQEVIQRSFIEAGGEVVVQLKAEVREASSASSSKTKPHSWKVKLETSMAGTALRDLPEREPLKKVLWFMYDKSLVHHAARHGPAKSVYC